MNQRDKLTSLCLYLVPGANQNTQLAYIRALMSLVDQARPDYIIDIGTNLGSSCMAMASAFHLQGGDMRDVATIDIHHGLWKRSISMLGGQFMAEGIDMDRISCYEVDFKAIAPTGFVPTGKGMVFTDVHDYDLGHNERSSTRFYYEWLSLVDEAIVAVHDVNPCDKNWKSPRHWPIAKGADVVKCWTGQWYRGPGEVTILMDYLNEHRVEPTSIPNTSIVWFRVENGVPK